MRTPQEIAELMGRIFETGGLTEDMEKDLKALKDELDERDGMLRHYGESADGERDAAPPSEIQKEEEEENWEGQYREMVDKYNNLKERFKSNLFSPSDDESEFGPEDNQEADAEPDKYQGLTVEQLFN